MYPCYRCSGEGVIRAFGHVLGGICFKCHGTGTQKDKPIKSIMWAVLDTNGNHVYNVRAKTLLSAIKSALQIFARAQIQRTPGAIEFVATHDMSSPTAVPYKDYWTEERLEEVQ